MPEKFFGIPDEGWPPPGPRPGHRREIDKVWHRICTGPGHDVPTWLPETDKYFHQHKSGRRRGTYAPRCRICQNWSKLKSPGLSGWVPSDRVRVWFVEGVNRVGMVEFCRRSDMNDGTVRAIIDGSNRRVQKRTVRRAMMAVISMRRKNEVRHRDSIIYGATARGKEEKTPTALAHLYRQHGDRDTEVRKRHRRRMAS